MKTINISLLISIFIFITSCTEKQTKIELVNDEFIYNIGEIQTQASTLSGKEWLIQNVGDSDLKIHKIETSCDCLKIMCDTVNPIGPNEYFPLRVFISPENTIGDFHREIFIYGNFEDSPLELTIEGVFVENSSEHEYKTDS